MVRPFAPQVHGHPRPESRPGALICDVAARRRPPRPSRRRQGRRPLASRASRSRIADRADGDVRPRQYLAFKDVAWPWLGTENLASPAEGRAGLPARLRRAGGARQSIRGAEHGSHGPREARGLHDRVHAPVVHGEGAPARAAGRARSWCCSTSTPLFARDRHELQERRCWSSVAGRARRAVHQLG